MKAFSRERQQLHFRMINKGKTITKYTLTIYVDEEDLSLRIYDKNGQIIKKQKHENVKNENVKNENIKNEDTK